jgi:hypothetical protein
MNEHRPQSMRVGSGAASGDWRSLAASLLQGDPRAPVERRVPPALALAGRVLVSLFVAYHAAVLVVYNLPAAGLSRGLFHWFERRLGAADYIAATGSRQVWSMFAPNPPRENVFIRVLVEDQEGELHDVEHDIYGRRSHPYVFYEHMGKVNQRLAEEILQRRSYAAWVCREWQRDHAGQPARAVHLVRLSTRIPTPAEVAAGTDDPRERPPRREPLEVVSCATAPWAQLPPRLRQRYGFAPAAPGSFRRGPGRTWAERRRAEPDPGAAGGGSP